MSKKGALISVGIIALIVLGVLAKVYWPKSAMNSKNTKVISTQKPNPDVKIVQTPSNQVPPGFPAGIPIESGATMVSNFSGTTSATQTQSTREFISKQTLDKNLSLYETWLKGSGWTVSNVVDSPTQKLIYAAEGKNNLIVRIYNAPDGKVHVGISNFVTTK